MGRSECIGISGTNCPDGQFMAGIDSNSNGVCKAVNEPITITYYFGGMYSHSYSGYTGFKNPLATNISSSGGMGCPIGYRNDSIFGYPDLDETIYLCWGLSTEVSKIAEFGGMLSTASGDYTGYRNPLTETDRPASECPYNYIRKQVLGRDIDNNLYWCYTTNLNDPVIDSFGGIYGGAGLSLYNNPVFGTASCGPARDNFQMKQAFGKPYFDGSIYFCYR